MLERLIPIALLAAACYWYWTGPYQESKAPSYEKRLKENALNFQRCMRGESFASGATGQSSGDPEEACAAKYNLYKHQGKWHSYDDVRQED
jgi:hypothetical protein